MAGLAGATGGNGVCGVGVAFKASLSGTFGFLQILFILVNFCQYRIYWSEHHPQMNTAFETDKVRECYPPMSDTVILFVKCGA